MHATAEPRPLALKQVVPLMVALLAAFFTAAALFSLFLPRWGDLIGRRKVLVSMMTITGLGCLVAALAPNEDGVDNPKSASA